MRVFAVGAASGRGFWSGSALPGVRAGLESALVEGDAEVRRAAARTELSEEMGTTVTIAYLLWPLLYVAHAGYSRCYLFHQDKLEQLTTGQGVDGYDGGEDIAVELLPLDEIPGLIAAGRIDHSLVINGFWWLAQKRPDLFAPFAEG